MSHMPRIQMLDARISPLVDLGPGGYRLMLPIPLFIQLSLEEQRSLIAHELAHVQRRDPLLRWLEVAATTIYWWYPVLWIARTQLRRQEELACDAIAVGRSGADPTPYAQAFLKAIDFLHGVPAVAVPNTCSIGAGRDCADRLRAILHQTNSAALTRGQWAGVAAAAMLLLPTGIAAINSAEVQAAESPLAESPLAVSQVAESQEAESQEAKGAAPSRADGSALAKPVQQAVQADQDRKQADATDDPPAVISVYPVATGRGDHAGECAENSLRSAHGSGSIPSALEGFWASGSVPTLGAAQLRCRALRILFSP